MKGLAGETAEATTDVDAIVEKVNETQGIISGVLTEQSAVTTAILD